MTALPDYVKWSTSVVDVETDDIKYTKIYCAVVRDTVTLHTMKFVNRTEAVRAGVEWNPEWKYLTTFPAWAKENIKVYVAHNGITFDFQAISDILGFTVTPEQQVDTLVISRLFRPQRENGHSLEAWGVRCKVEKSKFSDFSKFSLEMLSYCEQDTLVNVHTLNWLEKEKEAWGFSSTSIRLEHKVQEIIHRQEKHGFYLDRTRATKLLANTAKRLKEVELEMYKVFVPQPTLDRVMKQKYKKDKSISPVGMKPAFTALKAAGMQPSEYLLGQDVAYLTLEDFNLGSTKQVAERLIEIGWQPTNMTPTGLPKIDEDSLAPFAAEFPQVGLLSEYLMVRSRNSLATQWLDAVDDKGYVHGRVYTMGAITGRFTHQDPNMANVPAVGAPYGEECRGCWTVKDKENYRLVGCDASSLELRMLCHYMEDEDYTQAAVAGDIHALNMVAFGFCKDPVEYAKADPKGFKEYRNLSKRLLYAILYGAGDRKVGSIVGKSTKQGKELKENLFTGIPKFGKLVRTMVEQSHNGYVWGIDGRRIWTRSEHGALNTLLQGGGAVVCKLWMCYIHKRAKAAGLDFQQCVQVHDEYQFEVLKDHTEAFGLVTKAAMKDVEKFLKMKCPLDSEFKIGLTWAECH